MVACQLSPASAAGTLFKKPGASIICDVRAHRDSTNWKYMMHDLGLKLPTATAADVSLCFCGATITNASRDEHIHSLTG
jgi:hypothetical protein